MNNIFRTIREGDEGKARELCEQLKRNSVKMAVLAIMARNFSHGIGKIIPRPKKE